MSYFFAIDGACRRNGKPDCVASGGVLTLHYADVIPTFSASSYIEHNSTNQRGEMLALLGALSKIPPGVSANILTDSEYLFNTMTKNWCSTWAHQGWTTSAGEPVKNKDLWEKIYMAADSLERCGSGINYYHIKGHVIPFGTVTATNLLIKDPSGKALYDAVSQRYDELRPTKSKQIINAQSLSRKNNGWTLEPELLKDFVVRNTVVDAIATKAVEEADTQS